MFFVPNPTKVTYPASVVRVDNSKKTMWDLKLILIDLSFYVTLLTHSVVFTFFNSADPLLQNGFLIFNWKTYYQFTQNMSFFFGIKFLLSIAFLVLIRGGTPRYRYDYLTKLGWLKFLGFIIVVFFLSLLNFFLF